MLFSVRPDSSRHLDKCRPNEQKGLGLPDTIGSHDMVRYNVAYNYLSCLQRYENNLISV